MTKEIMKFQTEQTGQVFLIYNKDRSIYNQVSAPKLVLEIAEATNMHGPFMKKYFLAEIDDEGIIQIDPSEQPMQEW